MLTQVRDDFSYDLKIMGIDGSSNNVQVKIGQGHFILTRE